MPDDTDRVAVLTAAATTLALVVVLVATARLDAVADDFTVAAVAVGWVVAVVAVVRDAPAEALLVALAVTGTFAVNAVVAGDPYAAPGSLGTWVWLVDLVLLVTVPLAVVRGWLRPRRLGVPVVLFGGFVLWSAAVTFLGSVPRVDVAAHYTLYVARGWLAVALVAGGVRRGVLSLPAVGGAVVAAATGHAAVACLQAATGDTLGFRVVAEGSSRQLGTVSLLGVEVTVGPYVSGFTAAGSLSGLAALALPLALAGVLFGRSLRVRGPAAVAALLTTLALRFTDWDSGRGALLLQLGALTVYALWRAEPRGWRPPAVVGRLRTDGGGEGSTALDHPRRLGLAATAVFVSGLVLVLLFPSSTSGRAVGAGATRAASASVSVPFFDLSNLAIRLQQYVAGVAVFTDSPLFGVGGANFRYVAVAYGLPRPLLLHNLFVGLLAETGLVGFLLVTATLVGVADAGRRLWRAPDYPHSAFAVATLVALGGYLAVLSWQPQWIRISSFLPFWVLCGALLGADGAHTATRDDGTSDTTDARSGTDTRDAVAGGDRA